MSTVSLRGIELYYEIRGGGPRLCLIGGTGWDLRRAPSAFEVELARHFELLLFDQRGQGRSGKPDCPATMADYADDAEHLLAALHWDQCDVIGISFGGMVAQEVALRYPARIRRLVLCCTSSGGAGGSSWPLHQLVDLSKEEFVGKLMVLGDIRLTDAWQAGNAIAFAAMVAQSLARSRLGVDGREAEIGRRRQLQARAGHDTYDRLPSLTLPVYVCGGRHDGIAPPANQIALQSKIAGARLTLFDGGHQFYLQDLTAFDKIAKFLLGDRKIPNWRPSPSMHSN